ncbi:MAG: cytochrome b N-terminal domain-containing protein [candidate division Zixibacteria bacterium]
MSQLKSMLNRVIWSWKPESNREAGDAIVKNFLLHWFPHRVSIKSLSWGYSFWLGTISFTLFLILCVTGVALMFFYVPSVERAYWSVKDIEFAISFGGFLRALHRVAAHLMVGLVFIHMFRVFYTNAYQKGTFKKSARPLNWVLGVILLVLTLLLSFTGYLLPWDQLAFWAITVGTSIASAVPLIGQSIREFILGGTIIGQSTLIRFYVLHVFFLPLILFFIIAWHMWRVRKDGGLAAMEQVREESETSETTDLSEVKSKSYALMGIAKGTSVHIYDRQILNSKNSLDSSPHLIRRLSIAIIFTLLISSVLALMFGAPLEEPANPNLTPNPAKAPWYFLGLQELVSYSAFIGGVLVPGLAVLGLMLIPWMDRENKRVGRWLKGMSEIKWMIVGAIFGTVTTCLSIVIGIQLPSREILGSVFSNQIWFDLLNPATGLLIAMVILYFAILKISGSSRKASIALFTCFVMAFIILTIVGTWLRGPNWDFFWPWQPWPEMPVKL